MHKKLTVILIIYFLSISVAAQSLYVFIPTEMRASKLQQKIETFCTGVDVTVFGRAKDFHNKIETAPPTSILSLSPVIKHNSPFDTAITGLRDGIDSEDYVLVSIDKGLNLEQLNDKKIGVVDLLGRKPMMNFVEDLLKAKIKLKRVTKVEDLLPLITFDAVDAIFISNSLYSQFKQKSNLNLVATPLNIKVGLASAALSDNVIKEKLQKCILAFDKQLNSTLGVDQWHAL